GIGPVDTDQQLVRSEVVAKPAEPVMGTGTSRETAHALDVDARRKNRQTQCPLAHVQCIAATPPRRLVAEQVIAQRARLALGLQTDQVTGRQDAESPGMMRQ